MSWESVDRTRTTDGRPSLRKSRDTQKKEAPCVLTEVVRPSSLGGFRGVGQNVVFPKTLSFTRLIFDVSHFYYHRGRSGVTTVHGRPGGPTVEGRSGDARVQSTGEVCGCDSIGTRSTGHTSSWRAGTSGSQGFSGPVCPLGSERPGWTDVGLQCLWISGVLYRGFLWNDAGPRSPG